MHEIGTEKMVILQYLASVFTVKVAGLFCSVCFIKSFGINVTLKSEKGQYCIFDSWVILTAVCARDHLNNRFLSLDKLKRY